MAPLSNAEKQARWCERQAAKLAEAEKLRLENARLKRQVAALKAKLAARK
jgi:cell shape-determining protein MreC